MSKLMDTAYTVLSYGGIMSTMKMEKLVYYSQARSLAEHGTVLFPEDFQAWTNGPVCPDLFRVHKGMYAISLRDFRQRVPAARLLEGEDLRIVESVVKDLGGYTGRELSERTHRELPWRNARGDAKSYEPGKTIISKQAMRSYYSAG